MVDTVISGEFVTEVAFEGLAFDGNKANNAEPDGNAAGLPIRVGTIFGPTRKV